MNWRINYKAVFFSISNDQCDAWEEWLRNKIPDLDPKEIDRAVETLVDTWDAGEKRRNPTVQTIRGKIWAMRKVRQGGVAVTGREKALMDRMKGETPEQRWESLCEPGKWRDLKMWDRQDVCIRLEKYANTLPGKAKKPDFSALDKMAGGIGNRDIPKADLT